MPQLVSQHCYSNVGVRIELHGDADVAIAAGRRQQLGGRRGLAREHPPAHVDDQIRLAETVDHGAKGGRFIAAPV